MVDSYDTKYLEMRLLQQLKAYGLYGVKLTILGPTSTQLTRLMSEYLYEQGGLDSTQLANRLLA